MYNTVNVNPAYAGSRGVMSAFLLHRTQWVGLDGAPVTNDFSIHTPINNSNLGIGLSVVTYECSCVQSVSQNCLILIG
jgi:hypothetical protein